MTCWFAAVILALSEAGAVGSRGGCGRLGGNRLRRSGLWRSRLRRLEGAAATAATAAAAAAPLRRLGAVHRRIGDWVHTGTLFLGDGRAFARSGAMRLRAVVGRHVALRLLRAVLRHACVGCGFAW